MFYFSHFFTSFFIVIRRICLPAKVRKLVFIICSLLVGIDCVTDKLKVTFSWMKNTPFCPQISPHFRALKFWRTKNICAGENRMKQFVRTSFPFPRPCVSPPPPSSGVRFPAQTTENWKKDWTYHRQPSNSG